MGQRPLGIPHLPVRLRRGVLRLPSGPLPSYPVFSQGLVDFKKAPRPGGCGGKVGRRLVPKGLLSMEGHLPWFPVLP